MTLFPVISRNYDKRHIRVLDIMNVAIIIVSAMMIAWMSYDTLLRIDFMTDSGYLNFQLLVCVFFIADFIVGLCYAPRKWHYIRSRWLFLLVSIPYLNIISNLHIYVIPGILNLLSFVPLIRGALAMAIVVNWVSRNAVTSLFMSYLVIMLMVSYFCSLIFYQRESGVNPQVNDFGTALWWAAMNMSTVGCNIEPITWAGRVVAVILPCSGMVIFPLFTVYLTDYVQRNVRQVRRDHDDSQPSGQNDEAPS